MIIEYKKSSSVLLAVVLLTSLNCLAMEERAAGRDKRQLRHILPPATSFYANSWRNIKSYGPSAVTAGATVAVYTTQSLIQYGNIKGINLQNHGVIAGWLSSALLISYGQYKKRQEQGENRGTPLWYATPAVLVFAGKFAYNISRNQNYLENIADAAFDAVQIALPPAASGAFFAAKERFDYYKKISDEKFNKDCEQISSDLAKLSRQFDNLNKGKETESSDEYGSDTEEEEEYFSDNE